MDDFLILLQAKLDEAKSIANLNGANGDIAMLQGKLNALKLQATLDPDAAQKLANDIGKLINQKITISNINIDTNQAVRNAQQSGQQIGNALNQGMSKEVSKSQNALENFKKSLENAGKSSSEIQSIIDKVKTLTEQIDSLRFTESTKGFMNIDVSGIDEFGNRVKIIQSLIQDVGNKKWNISKTDTSIISTKELDKIDKTFADYTAKLAQFKSTNSEILSGLSVPIADFENKLSGLKNGTTTIDEVVNSFKSLNTEASNITANFSRQLSPIDSAIRNLAKGEETIAGLRAEIKGLNNAPKEINTELNKCSFLLAKVKQIESENGRTSEWSQAYKEWANSVDTLKAKLTTLRKEQSNVASTQIFKIGDLKNNDIAYMSKVYNTIEKQMTEINKMANAKGWNIVDISGVEQADGKIKQLTLTVKDTEGALKRLTMQREKLQGNGKAQFGLMQVGDIKVIETASQAQEKLAQNAAKANVKLSEQANKIQLSIETGGYESKVESLIARTRQWTDSEGQARINTNALSDAMTKLTQASEAYANNKSEATQKRLIESSKQLDTEYQKITNDVRKMNAEMAKDSAISSLHNQVNDFMSKNGKAVKYSGEFMRIFNETAQGAKLTREEIAKLNQEFNNAVVQARNAGKLGKTFFQTLREGMSSFSYWTSSTFLVMQGINKTKQAFSELKEINSIMTEISKVSQMTSKELQQLGNDAFESASKYGKTASDYLTGIQDFSRAGFRGDHADQMAELSVLAQAAGDMSAELSNKYLIATDAAYKLNGEASKLNEILDGQNYIANNNATSMEHLADATRVAASQAASAGVAVEEMSAAIGTMVSVTQDSGETAGRAFKAILMNLQQVSGELDNGEVIDEESLTKYEKACNELGVSLKTVKDGVVNLREPMEILKELSDAYTSLDKMDARRANLISAIGGKHRGNQLNALLENWQMYEKMLVDYSNGSGSAMREAMKSASNWEGSLNRLKNTWTDTVQHIANSDDVIQIINGFNGIVSVLDKVTGKLGTLGSIGLGAGIFTGVKNVGKPKMFGFNFCFEYADSMLVLLDTVV